MIQLRSLGALDLRRDGIEVRSVLTQPKRLALLAYLAAAYPARFHARDSLLALFWPEADTERARNALRQALHYLRRSLGEDAVIGRGDEVGVNEAAFRCDAADFDRAIAERRPEEALSLYQGEFLPGVFIEDAPEAERWLETERARRRSAAVGAAHQLAAAAEQAGDLATASVWARRALVLAPFEEGALRRLLAVLQRSGETAAALDAAEDFRRRLAAEYGLEPAPETRQLIDQLRRPAPSSSGDVTLQATGVSRPPTRGEVRPDTRDEARPSAPAPAPAEGATPDCCIPGAAAPPKRVPWHHRPQLAAALVVIVGLSAIGWFARTRPERQLHGDVLPSIAVLPFVNLSGDPDREYFSDGVTEELLNVLAQLPGLRVAARTSTFAFKGKDVSVDSIGRALRVAHVLEGSVRASGDSVRITAQLIDARTGYHVWSETYDADARDIFAVQDGISRAIAERLQVEMRGFADTPLARAETEDPEAHRLLLRSAAVFKDNTPEAWERAAGLARQAIARDSFYARAYASLAVIRMWQGNQHYLPLDSAYDEARALAVRARELDARIGDPLVVLGWIAMTRDRDYVRAERLFAEAEQLTPNDRRIPNYRAILLSRLGRNDDAIAAARRVTEIDPTFIGAYNNLAAMYAIDGQYERALEENRRALEMGPDRPATFIAMAMNFALAGQHDSAFAWGERAIDRLPNDQYALGTLGYAYARGGRAPDARALLGRMTAQPNASHYLQALVYAGLGEADTMFGLLEQALAAREEAIPDLPGDPSFRAYRKDPRMRALVQQIRNGQR